MGESSQDSRNPAVETHHSLQIPNLVLSPNPRPGLGSESSQQPHYLCMYTSLSLQGLEETFPNIDVTCKFPMPGRGDSHRKESEQVLACVRSSVNGVVAWGLFFFFFFKLASASGFCHQASAAGFYHLLKRSQDPWIVTPRGAREPGLSHTAACSHVSPGRALWHAYCD